MATRTHHQLTEATWFVTFTCYNWLPLFELTSSYNLVYSWIKLIKEKYLIETCGFVLMPNHVHLLLYVDNDNVNLNSVIGNGKRFMAYELVKRLKIHHPQVLLKLSSACTIQEKAKGQLHKVFEPSFDAKPVYTEAFLHQKLAYIHHNPVSGKWNLCADYTDYPHSSAAFYLDNKLHAEVMIKDYRELGWADSFSTIK
jgi:REP element-mobilizing transposase RayT